MMACGNRCVRNLGDGKNLLSFGVVGHAQVIDKVNSQNVVIEVFTDHKSSGGIPAFVGGPESVDPVEFKVVISGSDFVGIVIETFGF